MDIQKHRYSLRPICALDGRVLAAWCTNTELKFGNTPSGLLVVVIVEKICTHREWETIVLASSSWEQAADKAIAQFGGFSMLLPNDEMYEMSHLGAILHASLTDGVPSA